MSATGYYDAEFAGASSFDALDIDGNANLAGTLNLVALPGFTPFNGETFDILNFTSSSGTFSSVTGTDLGNGFSFSVAYNPTDVLVTVSGPVDAGPEPSTSLLLIPALLVVWIVRSGAGRRALGNG